MSPRESYSPESEIANREIRFWQGNEACVEGAILAGCRFYAGYPISPSTEIMETFSSRLPKLDGIFIQMEDEIGSLGAAIGASLAGAKAMTATSGPGFSLMQENLGFAVAAEVPCVIVDVMRLGPSTGLPTAPSQGDVMQARWGTHGDHPIIVLCPSSVKEAFELTIKAFNLSEQFRTPVILLMDEIIAHLREKTCLASFSSYPIVNRKRPSVPPEWYIPFEDKGSVVSPMAIFGDGYRYHVTGLIHDRLGYPTQRQDEVAAFTQRIFRKISQNFDLVTFSDSYLLEDSRIAIVAYGAVARSAQMAVGLARSHGIKAGLLKLLTLWPFNRKKVSQVVEKVDAVIVPEMNMGQISREVKRVNQGRSQVYTINKLDGTNITPQEIWEKIKEISDSQRQ